MWCALTFVIAVRRPQRRVPDKTQRTEKKEGKEGGKKSEFVRQIGISDGIGDQEDQILAGMLGQCSSLAVLSSTHNRFDDPRNHIRRGRVGI